MCSDSEMKFAYFWFLTQTESELLDLPAGRPVKVGHQGILSIHFLRVRTNTKNTFKQIQKTLLNKYKNSFKQIEK